MKTILYTIATLFACAIMWIVTQRYQRFSDDIHAMARDVEGIRRALEARSEAHVLFRVSPELRTEPETLVL